MTWPWFNGMTVRSFWSPITSPAEAWYRDTHVRDHVLGGVVWAVLARGFDLWVPFTTIHVADLRHAAGWVVVLAVGLWQLTVWEAVQRENWRPELNLPPLPVGYPYPWLSAIWDVLFTMAGAAVLELAVSFC